MPAVLMLLYEHGWKVSLTRVLHSHAMRAGEGTINLLALARLLALAFSDLPFVAHVLDGGAIEPFLPQSTSKPPRASTVGQRDTRSPQRSGATPSHLTSLVGAFVEVISIVNESREDRHAGHVFATIGRVIENEPAHVLLETLRGHECVERANPEDSPWHGKCSLMRTLSTDDS